MRKFLFEFVRNLISFLLILVIGVILIFLLVLSIVCSSKVVAWGCIGLDIVLIALIPTIGKLLESYHLIDKLAKLMTGYNETNEKRDI